MVDILTAETFGFNQVRTQREQVQGRYLVKVNFTNPPEQKSSSFSRHSL